MSFRVERDGAGELKGSYQLNPYQSIPAHSLANKRATQALCRDRKTCSRREKC